MLIPMENEYKEIVTDIWLRSVISGHPFIAENYWQDRCDLVKNEYLPNSQTFLFAAKDGSLQGFVSIIKAEDEFQPKKENVKGGFIGALFVAPEYQRQGAGTALLNYCKDNYDELYLAVYTENEIATQFYENQGFTILREQINLDTNLTEYIMFWSDDQDWCNLLMGMQC